jgi:drug/metabolite transporter (DMT)-like permease
MKLEPSDKPDLNQRILTCVGLSVVSGIVFGQLFDFQDVGGVRLVSLTGDGPVADLFLIVAAALTVLGGARMTVTLRPGALLILGVVLLVAALAGPTIFVHLDPRKKVSIPFLPLAVLEFIGAAFLGTGLRRLFWNDRTTLLSIAKDPDAE